MNIQPFIDDHCHFHSPFQMDHFITFRNGLTPYGCYKQALREWYTRYTGLIGMYVDREKSEIDLEEMEGRLQSETSEFSKRRIALDVARLRAGLKQSDKAIFDSEREFAHFLGQVVALKSAIGDLSAERRATLDRDLWLAKIRAAAAVDLLMGRCLRQSTVELLHSVSREDRRVLAQEIFEPTRHQALIDWYMETEAPQLNAPVEVDVRRLCCESAALPVPSRSSFLTAADSSAGNSSPNGSAPAKPAPAALA